MRIRRLGWAGVEIEAGGDVLLVDAIGDPGAVVGGAPVPLPAMAGVSRPGEALGALVTHMHRDHADAALLAAALAPDAPVVRPRRAPGATDTESLWVAAAEGEFVEAGLNQRQVDVWESAEIGPFTVTALPAVDAIGDPQIAWLIAVEDRRVLHLGDTMNHGFWWRMKQRHGAFDAVLTSINGVQLSLPHCQPPSPLPGSMTPEEAAIACALLGARVAVPIHYGAYDFDPYYVPAERAEERFVQRATEEGVTVRTLEPGETLEVAAADRDEGPVV